MSLDLIAALSMFALVASITPGPNNIMLMASGLNYGFMRTLPHMLGVNLGFVVMLLIVGFGLGTVFMRFPEIHTALKLAGSAYLVYLAWRIANAGAVKSETAGARPMSFLEAALFQWVNPKAWVMVVTAIATYTRPNSALADVLLVGGVFGLVNIPSIAVWVGFGAALQRVLREPQTVRLFNWSMAALLVASIVPILRSQIPGP